MNLSRAYISTHMKISQISRRINQVNKQISYSYITTHVADKNAAIFRRPLLGKKVQTHRDDVCSIAECHAAICPEVSSVNSATVRAIKENSYVHGSGLASCGDLWSEVSIL